MSMIQCNKSFYGAATSGVYLPIPEVLKIVLPANPVMYILGFNNDLSFESDIANVMNSSIHIFDNKMNINKAEQHSFQNNLSFHNWIISANETLNMYYFSKAMPVLQVKGNEKVVSLSSEVKSIDESMKHLRHTHVDLLRINTPNFELEILKKIILHTVLPRIIIVSYSLLEQARKTTKFLKQRNYLLYSNTTKNNIFIKNGCQIENLLHKAEKMSQNTGFVNVQVANLGFIDMTKSWICNVRPMNIVLPITLFIATDLESYQALVTNLDVNVVYIEYKSPKNMNYTEAVYYSYTYFRTILIYHMLKHGISLWSTEADAVWFDTPFPDMNNTVDIILVDNRPSEKEQEVSIGMIFLKSTKATLKFWEDLLAWRKKHPKSQEQSYLTRYVKKMKATSVWMSSEKYISGQWYDNDKYHTGKEKVIQNNWIVGNNEKIKRAKKFKHWFLKEDGSCI